MLETPPRVVHIALRVTYCTELVKTGVKLVGTCKFVCPYRPHVGRHLLFMTCLQFTYHMGQGGLTSI